jgi:hypothetical protein
VFEHTSAFVLGPATEEFEGQVVSAQCEQPRGCGSAGAFGA